jgi:thioredoxin reductase (NADPH)
MLRSTRKSAAIGIDSMISDTASPPGRSGTSLSPGLPQHHDHSHIQHGNQLTFHRSGNPYSQHYSSSMKGAILSHLVTAVTTALIVVLLWNRSLATDQNHDGIAQNAQIPSNFRKFDMLSRENQRAVGVASQRISTPYFDLVVVGAGPAGLTASIFAARAGLNVLVIGSESGLLSEATSLDNFPSWKPLTFDEKSPSNVGGQFWLETTRQQAVETGVYFAVPGLIVSEITHHSKDALFSLHISGKVANAMAVIIATGATGRKLKLPHELSFWGKSIHSCAICDGSSYKGKAVVVVGGGDAAVDAAILLSRHARSVIVVHRRHTFRASNQRNLQVMLNIHMLQVKTPFTVSQYLTKAESARFSGLEIRNTETDETEVVECDGVFVMIGSTPNSEFLNGFVELDSDGFIVLGTDGTTSTSVEGIFAAGEVTDNQYKQAITAAGAGAKAAIDAERWLRSQMKPDDANGAQRILPDTIPLQLKSDMKTAEKILSLKARRPILENVRESKPTDKVDCTEIRGEKCITELVHTYPVVVFSKSWCPYCKRALEALAVEGVVGAPVLFVVSLDRDANGIQSTLATMTGRRTVPNVFVGGKSIGGGDETVSLQRSGELKALLLAANAIAQK